MVDRRVPRRKRAEAEPSKGNPVLGADDPDRGRRDDDVVKVYGRRTAEAVLTHRPDHVVRGYFSDEHRATYGPMMHALARARTAYRILGSQELDRVCASKHHEGVCLLVKPREVPALEAWVAACPAAAVAVVLDSVRNPHNLGAIVRTAAHFGARGVWVLGTVSVHGAMARVAEGGTEAVDVFSVPSLVPVISALVRAGFQSVGASPDGEGSVFAHRFTRRTLIVLGSEDQGLSEEVRGLIEANLRVPGTGRVESLNVSSAAAIFLAEYARQRAQRRSANDAELPSRRSDGGRADES